MKSPNGSATPGVRLTAGVAPNSWFSAVDAVSGVPVGEKTRRDAFTPWTTNPFPTHRPMSGGSVEKLVFA